MDQRAVSAAARLIARSFLPGLAWIEAEAQKRFGKAFAAISDVQRSRIADDICPRPRRSRCSRRREVLREVPRSHRGGFYTTPVGMKDIGYVGNVPLESSTGPPTAR